MILVLAGALWGGFLVHNVHQTVNGPEKKNHEIVCIVQGYTCDKLEAKSQK